MRTLVNALGQTSPDPLSDALGTDIRRFESSHGIHGQYWIEGEPEVSRLHLLTVVATQPFTGQFKRFIAACKEEFDSVGIWECWNDALPGMLERWNFSRSDHKHCGDKLYGWEWEREWEKA